MGGLNKEMQSSDTPCCLVGRRCQRAYHQHMLEKRVKRTSLWCLLSERFSLCSRLAMWQNVREWQLCTSSHPSKVLRCLHHFHPHNLWDTSSQEFEIFQSCLLSRPSTPFTTSHGYPFPNMGNWRTVTLENTSHDVWSSCCAFWESVTLGTKGCKSKHVTKPLRWPKILQMCCRISLWHPERCSEAQNQWCKSK